MMSDKIGLYYTHYECFGHTSRIIAFVDVLRKKFSKGNFFFIQGGQPQPVANLDHLGRVYSLSQPVLSRKSFQYPVVIDPVLSAQRAHECLNILKQERPGTFITEYFPLGRGECRDEIVPVLVSLFRRNVSLFSIAGYPLLTGVCGHWMDFCLSLYRRVFIFSPLIERDYMARSFSAESVRQKYLDFFKRNEQKVVFRGYLPSRGSVVKPGEGCIQFQGKGVVRVAVVRGGGAVYPQIILAAIEASQILGGGYEFILVTGPSTSDAEWKLFTMLMAKKKTANACLVRWTDQYEQLIAECDVCVCLASYHMSLSLLKNRRRAVIIPFEGYGEVLYFREQPVRARFLKDHIRSEVLPFKKLSGTSLAGAIRKVLKRDMRDVHVLKAWFCDEGSICQELFNT